MLIVMTLADDPRRLNELKRQLDGISQRMLTLPLRGLDHDGLVTPHRHPSIPPRVDYALTKLGVSLRDPVRVLGECRSRRGNIASVSDLKSPFNHAGL